MKVMIYNNKDIVTDDCYFSDGECLICVCTELAVGVEVAKLGTYILQCVLDVIDKQIVDYTLV